MQLAKTMANRKCLDSMYDELYIVYDLNNFVDPPNADFCNLEVSYAVS